LLYALTVPVSTVFLHGRLGWLRLQGFDVHLVSSPGSELEAAGQREGVTVHSLRMRRSISPFADMVALVRAWRLLHRLKPDIVDAATPKASLLFNLAGALHGVPCRVYSLLGIRLETTTGPLRWLLTQVGRVTCACAHVVTCNSPSLRRRAIELGFARPDKFVVVGSGSVNGVPAAKFAPSSAVRLQTERLRQELGIGVGVPVVGFVGRLTRDKGIPELVEAYFQLRPVFPSLVLLLVGPFEKGDPIDRRTRQLIESTTAIVTVGYVKADDIVPYYHVMDVLAFPTHREGFGNVSLEAAAAGKPVVTTEATGAVDSVEDGITGLVVPVGNASALAGALGRLLTDPALARKMGQAGQERAVRDFRPERIWVGYERIYRELLRRTGAGAEER
jgi:glycosyltransferase involved in cell wall biosynthesis